MVYLLRPMIFKYLDISDSKYYCVTYLDKAYDIIKILKDKHLFFLDYITGANKYIK